MAESDRLLELLGGLPLAIAQAGAFLQETGVGLITYLELYEQQWSELMESDDPLLDYPDRSVWTTWEISYQAIRKKHEQTANLLLLWSFLDNKDLWHGLFTGACEGEYSVAETLSEWIGKIASSELQFGRAMKLLRSYSLVEEVVESNSHATHPVVHQWARHSQGRDFETKLSRLAVIIVGLNVPDQSVGDYPLQRRLLPHAQVCSRHILETKAFDHLEVAQDTDEGASQFVERRAVLISIDCLGTLYYSQSKLAEANELCERAFCGMEIVLGPNDELTLMSGNNLGLVYWTQGKFEEAATKFECVLLAMEEVLGCSHLTTVGTVHNLGMVYEKQDKLAEAEQMYERALKVKEVVLGPSHPSTLDTSGTLGGLYMSQGIISKAEPIYKRVLQGQEKTLGPLHPSTLGTINNLGGLYMSQGMLVEAEQKFERALRGYEEVQGKEGAQQYMPALDTLQNMGIIYQKRGEIARAKETWERALSGYINVLGPSNDTCKNLSGWIEDLSARQKHSEETEGKEGKEKESESTEHEERQRSTKKRKRRNVS
jgi:tetratricopeptide (TPR) repeat protein